MKNKMFSNTFSLHLRGAKELHKISPKLFPVMIFHAVISGLLPYVTVFFSARILKELTASANETILWKWVLTCVLFTGILGILKAWLHQRFTTLFDDMWGEKKSSFAEKHFLWILQILINNRLTTCVPRSSKMNSGAVGASQESLRFLTNFFKAS